jgi:hypothetical protein
MFKKNQPYHCTSIAIIDAVLQRLDNQIHVIISKQYDGIYKGIRAILDRY